MNPTDPTDADALSDAVAFENWYVEKLNSEYRNLRAVAGVVAFADAAFDLGIRRERARRAGEGELRKALARTVDANTHEVGCPYIYDGPVRGRNISMCNCRVSRIRKLLAARPAPSSPEAPAGQTTGGCIGCGGPLTRNPHPQAGKMETLLEIGAVWECIPCLVRSRHRWCRRATDTMMALREVKETAAAHHADQPAHVLLHSLTVDIPAMCDAVTDDSLAASASEPPAGLAKVLHDAVMNVPKPPRAPLGDEWGNGHNRGFDEGVEAAAAMLLSHPLLQGPAGKASKEVPKDSPTRDVAQKIWDQTIGQMITRPAAPAQEVPRATT